MPPEVEAALPFGGQDPLAQRIALTGEADDNETHFHLYATGVKRAEAE